MKDATGELSTTVITVVAIAAIAGLFSALLLPMLKNQITLTQACNNGPGYRTTTGDGIVVDCTSGATSCADVSGECKVCTNDKAAYVCTIGTTNKLPTE